MALEVHGGDGVELLFAGVGEHPVADDARVVHQNVEAAERVDCGLDETLGLRPVRDVGSTGDGFATGGGDLVDHALGCTAAARGRPVEADADVVDDDARALGGEGQRVCAPDSAARSRDDDHPAVEQTHLRCLPCYLIALVVAR